MNSQAEKVIGLYRKFAQIPSVVSAHLVHNFNEGLFIHSTWSQRNLERGKITKFKKFFFVDKNLKKYGDINTVDISVELLSSLSPSEKLRAVIREDVDPKHGNKQFLEVWRSNSLWRNIDLASLELHGPVYVDAEFRTLEWAPCGTKILYVAEKKVPKSEPFYKRKPTKPKESTAADIEEESVLRGEEYLYRQDWGEQLVGKKEGVICIYDANNDTVNVLSTIPEGLFPGQLQWIPDGSGVFGIAYSTEPRKLGLYACTGRKNQLFMLTLDGRYKPLSAEGRTCRQPRVSPTGDTLVWLERPTGGPHHCCMAIMKMSLPITDNSQPEVLLDIVDTVKSTTNGTKFYGFYSQSLPSRCFSADGKRLLFSTPQEMVAVSYVLHIESGNLYELELCPVSGSQILLDVNEDYVISVRSSLTVPDTLFLAKLPEQVQEATIEWQQISEPPIVEGIDNFNFHYKHFMHDNNDEIKSFNGIYFGPDNAADKSTPLVLLPHGGPHMSIINAFANSVALYASLGFATLLINYRGSTGMGQRSVLFLPSRAGSADVQDCVRGVQDCCRDFPALDPARVALSGGSHGGFLVAHLSGQFPEMFCAVVARNPVIDIASMFIVSDIPDWCSVEVGTEYQQEGPMSESLLNAQRLASPIVHAYKVKAPTLLLIGSKDLRVPPSQGIDYYHRLQANGVKVRMHLYEDNHSLALVPVEMDSQINGMLWLLEHTS